MVQERDSTRTSSGQYLSPRKTDRPPLANISAKMQSPSPKAPHDDDEELDFSSLKASSQPEFGKASPLRNPLKKSPPSIFIPKKPQPKVLPNRQFVSSAAQQAQNDSLSSSRTQLEQGSFYMPGQQPTRPFSQNPSSSQAHDPGNSFRNIPKPRQPYQYTSVVPPKSRFSSLDAPPYRPLPPKSKQMIDLTGDDDEQTEFDPDAGIREERAKFGQPDPFMYVDPNEANENIKNLLEGAFEDDDEDKSRTRLRRRAKKALRDGNNVEAQTLADKLASLKVKDEEKAKADAADEQDGDDEEDGTVEGMTIKLLPHQVEGVKWMIDKEIGKAKKQGVLPRGGILADDMGLGKTVQSVALILTNPRPPPDAKPEHPKQKLPGKEVGKSTLVVAPLALIKQWEHEIKDKVSKSHALRVLVHHGPNRTKSAKELAKYDVVITTYQTLTSEHAASQMSVANGIRIGCMGVYWYRLMLDEAHSIKNRNAKSTQACCALNSWYRWCLTGTPMQNSLDELQSLIKFLRIKPYCDLSKWKSDIIQPMKSGRGGLAMKRLQWFLRAFMKRRTKDILKQSGALNFGGKTGQDGEEDEAKQGGMKIVKREVVNVECDFNAAEQEYYDRLQNRADAKLQAMMKQGKGADYIGALVLLLRLRQACNHPALIEQAMSKDKDTMDAEIQSQQSGQKYGTAADTDIDSLTQLMGAVTVETKRCDVCQADLSPAKARNRAARCTDCENDLSLFKESEKRSKSRAAKQKPKRKQHQLPNDSDDAEGEGEWIADEPEHHLSLGKAGGSDDEDAEGGGETLGSIDSERSANDDDDEEDSPPRASKRRPAIKQQQESDDDNSTTDSEPSDSENERSFPSDRETQTSPLEHQPSTKVRQLLRILHAESPKHKTIVFSQFTTMLDLIQPHLKANGLRYVRYDGSMRNDAREAALHSLRTDKSTRILLCSLKCGSLGLNLTAASRVIIVEPFWNPFVEEQAIDRVHRLNQTVDVKVYRLTIRHSVEEKILSLQERKRELAKAAIEGAGSNGVNKLTMQEILGLFKHDAVTAGAHDEEDRRMWEKFGDDHRLLDGGSQSSATSRDDFGNVASQQQQHGPSSRRGKVRPAREHEVYGRRW